MNLKKTAIAAAIALSVVGVAAYAHGGFGGYGGYGGYGMGPWMMGGYGGYGGYGMMHGYGGYGGYGMGPGMMGGYGYGAGPGMMGVYALVAIERLDLTDAQRKQLGDIEDALRKKNWELMGKLRDEMWKLRSANQGSNKLDWDAIQAANKRATDLRQQMFDNAIQATKQAEALLTPQQREQYKRLAASRFDDDDD